MTENVEISLPETSIENLVFHTICYVVKDKLSSREPYITALPNEKEKINRD
jgi:hypothetical protein